MIHDAGALRLCEAAVRLTCDDYIIAVRKIRRSYGGDKTAIRTRRECVRFLRDSFPKYLLDLSIVLPHLDYMASRDKGKVGRSYEYKAKHKGGNRKNVQG